MKREELYRIVGEEAGQKVIEVYVDNPRYFGSQWKLYGPWPEEDLAPVEEVLLELDGIIPYESCWQLYDNVWPDAERFIARRSMWEFGPFIHGKTVEELIASLRCYYSKPSRRLV